MCYNDTVDRRIEYVSLTLRPGIECTYKQAGP